MEAILDLLRRLPEDPFQEIEAPETMVLTPTELARAQQIKASAQARSDTLRRLSDFDYVQYALCTDNETLEEVLQRMEKMQAFRQEYSIQDTLEDAMDLLTQTQEKHPGYVLSIDYVPTSRNFLTVFNWSKLNMSGMRTHQDMRLLLVLLYYEAQCKLCQFSSMRTGTSIVTECMGTTEAQVDFRVTDKMLHEYYRWYPENNQEWYLLNAPTEVVHMFALWKRFLSPHRRESVQLNRQLSMLEGGQSIDVLYGGPTPEDASLHVQFMMKRFLELRYKNEREFSLPQSG
jgi:hypothetical protein